MILAVASVRLYDRLKHTEQENAKQTLFAMQGFLHMNDLLQNAVKIGSMERYELSSMQQQILCTQIVFDRARQQQILDETSNENYRVFFVYLTALEDIVFKIENTKPLEQEILSAFTDSLAVAGGQYEYNVAEYMQLMAIKTDEAIASLNLREQSDPNGEGVITIYPEALEIQKAFLALFK